MTRKYTEEDITGFRRDLEKIQAKPTLYIGPTDGAGVFTLLRECLDNAVDEARAGRNDFIGIHIEGVRGPFWIHDSGVGIPVGIHKKMKISTLTHVLTNLQSSGKMQVGGAYKSAVGTHGVGIKATNALSSSFEVWTYRKDAKGWHYTKFEKGIETVAVKRLKSGPSVPNAKGKTTPSCGTVVKFTPDEKFFGKHRLDLVDVARWAKMTAYMNAGLKISMSAEGKRKEWYSKEGIKAYLKERVETLKVNLFSKKFIMHTSQTLEMALAFTDVENCNVEFFTNTVRNVEEGVHADDVYRALFDSLKPYMKLKVSKGSKKNGESKYPFTPADIRDGLLGVVNYKIDAPQFDSQTKEKLVDQRVKGECYKEALHVFHTFWKDNKSLAKSLIQRATELRSKTSDFLKDKKMIKNVNAAAKNLKTKLSGIVGNAPVEKRELIIVEGDSAAGTAKRARNKAFQAIYALRGKPLNAMEAAQAKVSNNAEIVGLLAAIGVKLDAKNEEKAAKAIQYGKIIKLADPDVDGKHINVLIDGNIWKYAPHIINSGRMYAVLAPLYKCIHKGRTLFGMTKDEIYKQTGSPKVDVQYIKGWGEISEDDMGVALDPGKRTLIRISPPSRKEADEFQQLLGKSPEYRKKLLGVG